MDKRLYGRLSKIEKQIELLKIAEETYLTLEANKEILRAQLFLRAEGKSIAEKEALVFSSKDWIDFSKGLVKAETERNHEKRRYEMRLKAFDAEYTTYKIEAQGISRQQP